MWKEKWKMDMSYWNRMFKYIYFFLLSGICICLTSCGTEKDGESGVETIEIDQEIEEYMNHFIELYTGNVFDDTKPLMNIEEKDITYEENDATLVKYTDSYGESLRYEIRLYGETMNSSINYYLCEDFVLISRKNNYYSSWILTTGSSDILYTTIDNWVVIGEKIYILHDNGSLEEVEYEKIEIPLLEEIEIYTD